MKSAISGSHGFIGSHLSKRLQALGHQVLPISQELLYQPKELETFFKREKPDYIYHLASYGNMANQKDVAMIVFANLIGSFNMLSASLDIPYKAFYYMSSSSVTLPRETYYSAAKAGAERLCFAFNGEAGKPIVILRPYSVYGPGEADFRFIPTVCRALIKGEEIEVDEWAVHDWIYIDDLVSAILHFPIGLKHLGTGTQTTNYDVVKALEKISGKKLKYKPAKLRNYDTNKWVSPQAIPHITLEEGLKKTYGYYEQRFKA